MMALANIRTPEGCGERLAPSPAIRNPQSAIRDPQSAIRNPQSAIRDPQSFHLRLLIFTFAAGAGGFSFAAANGSFGRALEV